jgi:hypothetical protein
MNSQDKTVNDINQIVNIEISKAKLVKKDGAAMYEAGATLQRNAKPLLEQLEGLLGASSLEYKRLVDKCAKAVLQCCIDSFNTLQNKIEDGEVEHFKKYAPKIKTLLASVDTTMVSDIVKDRIETSLKTIFDIVHDLDGYVLIKSHLCYYCGKNKAVPSAQYKQLMFLETGRRETTSNDIEISYKQCEIKIDRCEQCKKIHDKGSGWILAVFAVCIVAASVVLCIVTNVSFGLAVGWFLGLIIGFIVKSIVDRSKRRKYHIKMDEDVLEHPLVKKLKKKGWAITEPTA